MTLESKPNNSTRTKLIIDLFIFIGFLIAMDPRSSGIAVHEWLTLSALAAILIHLLLNWDCLAQVTRRLFGGTSTRSRINYLLNWLLFIDGILIMLSGILISEHAMPALGLRLPIQPGKGYSITGPRPRNAPGVPIVCRERSVAITPWQQSYRVGSTMEFSGYDTRLDRTRLDALLRGAAEYVDVEPFGTATVEEWYGWRPMTYDDLPIIGTAPGIANLMLATGHGMLGMSMSAATGLLVADLLLGRKPQIDPSPYAPTRFH